MYYRADFGGAGWACSGVTLENNILTSGYSYLEIDYLTVRESMAIYELLVRQIRATNGNLLITAGAVADSVSGSYIWFEDPSDNNVCPFAINDLIKAKRFDAVLTQLRSIEATVSAISGRRATVTYNTGTAQKGDEFVRIGNTSNSARQGSILLSADDTNSPYIDIINGIDSFTDWGNASFTKVRLGNLTGITDATFGALSGYGLYTENAYLTVSIKATAGEIGGFTIAGDSLSGGTINGGTITGGTIRTATGTGQRIVMASNKLTFYDAFNNDVELYGSVESIYSSNRLGSATILASPTIEVGDWWDDSFVQIDRSGNNIRILAQDGDGIPVTTVDVGIILADVNLYRSGANVLTTDENPSLILTKGEMEDSKLLIAGSEDSVFIHEEQLENSKDVQEALELSEGEYEIIEDVRIDVSGSDDEKLNLKLDKLMKRIDHLSKDEFIDFMGFQSNSEFLDWLTRLPDDSSIRVEGNIVYFK